MAILVNWDYLIEGKLLYIQGMVFNHDTIKDGTLIKTNNIVNIICGENNAIYIEDNNTIYKLPPNKISHKLIKMGIPIKNKRKEC